MDPTQADTLKQHLRIRLTVLREEKDRLLTQLRIKEIDEEQVQQEFLSAFPGEVLVAAVPFDELSAIERRVVQFVARRGRIKRVASLRVVFQGEYGVGLTQAAFLITLTRLREKGVLSRSGNGWMVEPDYLVRAQEPLPPMPRPKSPQERLAEAVCAAPRRQKPWAQRARGELPPFVAKVLAEFPTDRATTVAQLATALGEGHSKGGHERIGHAACELLKAGLVSRLGHGVYARSGVTMPPEALPTTLQRAMDALPAQGAISVSEWTASLTGEDSRENRAVVSARASVLVRQGYAERVGRGLYRRASAVKEERPKRRAPDVVDLPRGLRAILDVFPTEGTMSVGELGIACDGVVVAGNLHGHVFRLLQRGLIERVSAQIYRRVGGAKEDPATARLLPLFGDGECLSPAQVVVKLGMKLTASAMAKTRAELEALVDEGKLERKEGGYGRVG